MVIESLSPKTFTCQDIDALDSRLLFAIPKKVLRANFIYSLHEKCLTILSVFFFGADIQFRRHNRLDVCLVLNHNIALVFLPASDIPSFVGKGNVDLGITGHDVILESQMQNHVTETLRLGFGKCALQVQVPEASTIKNVEDLAGKRVVTSFEVLSGEYFGKLDEKFNLSGDQKTKIEYVGGSVEAAWRMELVQSGDTIRAAGLHAIATLIEFEVVLIKSTIPKHPGLSPLIDLVTSRIAGVTAAGKYVVCQYNISRCKHPAATLVTPRVL
ncbi:ATP phosphoribosyltransferase [Mycena leptocephala]|nr:ATP phosphoribosyltransferase [Mycena leptocephala]